MEARQLFIQIPGSDRIRFTKAGIERYQTIFGQAGFDIMKINNMEEFERAVDASFALKMQKLATTTRGQDTDLDKLLDGLPGWD